MPRHHADDYLGSLDSESDDELTKKSRPRRTQPGLDAIEYDTGAGTGAPFPSIPIWKGFLPWKFAKAWEYEMKQYEGAWSEGKMCYLAKVKIGAACLTYFLVALPLTSTPSADWYYVAIGKDTDKILYVGALGGGAGNGAACTAGGVCEPFGLFSRLPEQIGGISTPTSASFLGWCLLSHWLAIVAIPLISIFFTHRYSAYWMAPSSAATLSGDTTFHFRQDGGTRWWKPLLPSAAAVAVTGFLSVLSYGYIKIMDEVYVAKERSVLGYMIPSLMMAMTWMTIKWWITKKRQRVEIMGGPDKS